MQFYLTPDKSTREKPGSCLYAVRLLVSIGRTFAIFARRSGLYEGGEGVRSPIYKKMLRGVDRAAHSDVVGHIVLSTL